MAPSPDSSVLTCPRCGRPKTPTQAVCSTCDAEATLIAKPPAGGGDAPTVFSTDTPTTFAGEAPTTSGGEAPTTLAGDAPTMATPATFGSKTPKTPTTPTGDSGPLATGETFGRYTIVRLLGIGGMGAVYQAWDSELDVVVALKVIRPEVLKDPAAEQEIERRFKRELLLARQVTHKNVVRIHDLGEIRGIKYITMSYVEGTDLSTLVKKEGRLPIATTLRVMRAVVSGLVAAHTAGVVHRDLKPANIMVDNDGEALIMDFGIARSTGVPGTPTSPAPSEGAIAESLQAASRYTHATTFGSIVGTVEYMAPEQALGQAVDQRADIYTTGLILYDLLSGVKRSGLPGTALERLRARMERPLPALKSLVPDVPDALAAIVTKAIEIDAAKRYQTTVELEQELARLDEQGVTIPLPRRFSPLVIAAGVALMTVIGLGTWWLTRTPVVKQHDPVSVLIADLQNQTGDAAFDHTLEPMIKRALEGAGFISAHDRKGIRDTLGIQPPEKLDEAGARDLAVKQGVGFVLSGSIDRQGAGYGLSLKVVETVTGKVIGTATGRATANDQVLGAATKLVTTVRKALGDDESDTAQMFAMASVSATSPEVVREYAAAREASSNQKFDEARAHYARTVELDPKFGIGYQGLAALALNQNRPEEAEKYVKEAFKYLDGMTERERYTTRGLYYTITADYQQCAKDYTDLIAKYPAEVLAHNNLALCLSYLRNLPRAVDEMKRLVDLLPKRALFRINLALYGNYATDFPTGEREGRALLDLGRKQWGFFNIALAQLGQGQLAEARSSYDELAKTDGVGPSLAASGLGDLAIVEGRFADAVRILEAGAAADLQSKPPDPDKAAAKFAAVGYAQALRQQKPAAIASAQKALTNAKTPKIRFLAGRIFAEAGDIAKARAVMTGLAAEVQAEPQAYAKVLEGEIAIAGGDARAAIKPLTDAGALLDTWIGHFDLGRAYLGAGMFPQADSEFDRCVTRRGEALSLFLDQEPTYGNFPIVYYYQGRVREALQSAQAAESYRTYLTLREKAGEDPLLAEVRKRAGK